MVSEVDNSPMIGRQLFDVITSGMYDNPLMIFREYIQNSVDSIDQGIDRGVLALSDAEISIQLHGQTRCITIQDNGLGLSNLDANVILRSLGCSPKEGGSQRGFRGIGRLGGLAYCDEVIFETRSAASEDIAVISWDRKAFEKVTSEAKSFVSLADTLKRVSNHAYRSADNGEPFRFFRVTLKNVHRFHSDVLMNVKSVTDYLAQVAPVDYQPDRFTFAHQVQEWITPKTSDFRAYNITVNGRQVRRPYADTFPISTNVLESIREISFFSFNGSDSEPIAVGWYAKTGFTASLPSSLNCRGIRVRQGNIEIGDEHFLDDMFSERRFASWLVGEIHVVNNKLKPNARRDGFEQSPNFESFLEQASLLGRHLSSLCRKHSNDRIARVRAEGTLHKVERLFDCNVTYLDEEHYEIALIQARASLSQVEKAVTNSADEGLKTRFHSLKAMIESNRHRPIYLNDVLDGRKLRGFDRKSLLKHVAKTVIESYNKSNSPEDMLQTVFASFAKQGHSSTALLSPIGVEK